LPGPRSRAPHVTACYSPRLCARRGPPSFPNDALPIYQRDRARFSVPDLVLIVCSVAVAAYLLIVFNTSMRMTTGTAFAPVGISFAAVAGTALIMELTRRVAGLALVVIGLVFLVYVFAGPYLPGFLGYPGLSAQRFFSQIGR